MSMVIICDYLKTIGRLTDELDDLELPSIVEEFTCKRVEFFQKLGLTIDYINEYPLILGCSVPKMQSLLREDWNPESKDG